MYLVVVKSFLFKIDAIILIMKRQYGQNIEEH